MRSFQYRAGYCLGVIREGLLKANDPVLNGLMDMACTFEVLTNIDLKHAEPFSPASIPAVLHNLIVRGMPTHVSLAIEEAFQNRLGVTERREKNGGIYFPFSENHYVRSMYGPLHLIDPRLKNIEEQYDTSSLDSSFEQAFLFQYLPKEYQFLPQVLETQRHLDTIVPEYLQGRFHFQRVDFSIEQPYFKKKTITDPGQERIIDYRTGKVIEIDGNQYHGLASLPEDRFRDYGQAQAEWGYQRIRENQLAADLASLKNWLESDDYIQKLKVQFDDTEWSEDRLLWMQLVLSPLAIARIQYVLAELLATDKFPKKEVVRIGVLERDVPCGHLAIKDFQECWLQLAKLQNPDAQVPIFEIETFSTYPFKECALHGQDSVLDVKEFTDSTEYDLVLDVSMLWRAGILKESLSGEENAIIIRSSHHQKESSGRRIYSSDPITYQAVVTSLPNGDYEEKPEVIQYLKYFLQNCFRKESFRPGQLPILGRALQNKTVIGLLPTGGGKSLTYQLAALLQPGICIIVDPLRSLMQDQYENLFRDGLDASCFINSSLSTGERKFNINEFTKGRFLFCFISPERLQTEEFRNAIKSMPDNEHFFNYCVIDEAHCVSEWGHDFRTSYLALGQNAIKFCQTRSGKPIPLFGLTATASFDVLADVERELAAPGHPLPANAVVRFENTIRPELQTVVLPVSIPPDTPLNGEWQIKNAVGKAKQDEIVDLFLHRISGYFERFNTEAERKENARNIYEKFLSEQQKQTEPPENYIPRVAQSTELDIPDPFFDEKNRIAGIIFCPHTRRVFGVTNKYAPLPHWDTTLAYEELINHHLDGLHLKAGTFIGSSNTSRRTAAQIDTDSFGNLSRFTDNKLNLMIATKAFGMGINKPNIRFSVHVNYPTSIEGFVQEAGRAGRDGQLALNFILLEESMGEDERIPLYFFNKSFKGVEKEWAIIQELLTEIIFPPFSNIHRLQDLVFEETGEQVSLSVWNRHDLLRLYVDEGYGYINLQTMVIAPSQREGSHEVLAILREAFMSYFEGNIPPEAEIIQWLNQAQLPHESPGIERVLDPMAIREETEIIIPFLNTYAVNRDLNTDDLVEIIANNGVQIDGDAILEKVIKRFPETSDDLFDQALPNVGVRREDLSPEAIQLILDWYHRRRDKADTAKGIYRLLCLGLIEDYTVDYRLSIYRVKLVKHPLAYYRRRYFDFLKRYYSDQRARQLLKDAETLGQASQVRNYLRHMVEFIYRQISRKRRLGIDDMKALCKIGLDPQRSLEENNHVMKEFVFLYFNSKYSRRNYEIAGKTYSLLEDTKEAVYSSWEIVWKYLIAVNVDPTGTQIDNVKHLRGASLRLLRANPDNPTLQVLKGFSLLIISTLDNSPSLLKEGIESTSDGVLAFQEQEGMSDVELVEQIERFRAFTLEFTQQEEVIERLENAFNSILIKILAARVAGLKNKYLGKYV